MAQRICSDGPIVEGIDVSRYQEVVDWVAVRESGHLMAIARVSDGTRFPDTYFARNWSAMALQGFVRGGYQFFRAGQDPIAQASLFLDFIQNDPIGWGDFPPLMDIETSDGQQASVVRAKMQTWLDYMEAATGTIPIIYTANFMSNVVGPGFGSYYPLWVANWRVNCPLMPLGWNSWIIWQYSSTGRVPGVQGNVDLDQFNGSLQDLFDYVGDPSWRSSMSRPEVPIPEDDLSRPGGSVMGDGIRAHEAKAGRPDWEEPIDWSIEDVAALDSAHCPAVYAYPECIHQGGRHCLMEKAIRMAKGNECANAFWLAQICQCHNQEAERQIIGAGQEEVCSYLKTK